MKLFGLSITRASAHPSADVEIRRSILLLAKVIMDQATALASLTTAVAAQSAVVSAAVAKISAPAPVAGVDPQAVADAAATVAANTAALVTALNPPPAVEAAPAA
jgi:hypothetical protein